ncbi:MAG: LytTR family transcriptional regulator DNA-binding domain-containing protein [Clostridiales bacterium]|nr:LytTR family transcriptional regulator DNA-binding domain-containing protein [Clostridiales bacterium]
MEIKIRKIGGSEQEYIEIGCHRENEKVDEIVRFVRNLDGSISGSIGDKKYEIPVSDIFYIESVDNRTFIYTSNDTYAASMKLYEFEDLLKMRSFLRISKSTVLNIMKVESVKPALNGRFLCRLKNGEEVIISRKYVSDFREYISRKVR